MGWLVPLLGPIELGGWQFSIPIFNWDEYFKLGSCALAITLLCLMESASSVKSLVAKTGQKFDINQEMFSLGMANLGCALTGAIPCSTSPSRSNLSLRSGAKTGLNNVFSGLLCLGIAGGLGFLTAHVPVVTLSSLIFLVGFGMIQKHAIRLVMRSTPGDAVVFLTTFLSGLIFPLDSAVYIGVLVSIALFLRKASTPQMVEYTFDEAGQLTQRLATNVRSDVGISIVHVEGNLFFGAADVFHDQMRRVCEDKNLKVVILKMRNAYHLDATSVLALEELIRYMKDEQRVLLFSEVRRDMFEIFKRSGLIDFIGSNRIFMDNKYNPTLSTARALRRAQEILGNNVTRISIYT
jgi:SulP family sulfate permease